MLQEPVSNVKTPGICIDILIVYIPNLAEQRQQDALEGEDHANVHGPREVGYLGTSRYKGDPLIGDLHGSLFVEANICGIVR